MSYIKRRKRAFKCAGAGLWRLLLREDHARIHAVAAVAVIVAGAILGLSPTEWCLVALCIGAVFMAEAFNTAIETLADRVSKERDPLIGAAKDLAAGAVLAISLAAAATGLIIFIPKIF